MINNPNESKMYSLILRYWLAHGYAPDYRELASQSGLTPGTVGNLVKRLSEKGYVRYVPGVARTVRPAGMEITVTVPDTIEIE